MLKTFTQNPRNWRFHIGFWIVYGLWYWTVNILDGTNLTPIEPILITPFFALICYVCEDILERFALRGAYGRALFSFLVFFVAFSVLAYFITYRQAPSLGVVLYNEEVAYTHLAFLQSMFVIVGRYGVFGFAYFLIKQTVYYWKGQLAEEKAKQRYEYRSLAGTASLHLMSNLTDRWYVALRDLTHEVASEIKKAYHVMLYFMQAQQLDSPKVVTLRQEWDALHRYMDLLQQTSFNPQTVQLELPNELASHTIPPTTLISLFENYVKHGETNDPDKPAQFKVERQENGYRLRCSNYINKQALRISHGLGLENLKRRLTLQYGNRFQLETNRTGDLFICDLRIMT